MLFKLYNCFDFAGVASFGEYQQMPQPPVQQQQQGYYPTAPPAVSADEIRLRRMQRFANNN